MARGGRGIEAVQRVVEAAKSGGGRQRLERPQKDMREVNLSDILDLELNGLSTVPAPLLTAVIIFSHYFVMSAFL